MAAFIVRRLIQATLVMLVVALIAFLLFNYVGDPINNMVGQDTTAVEREALREQLGLNDPFYIQFGRFVEHILEGNFGRSYRQSRPVEDMIADYLPATLELAVVSAILALVFGVAMGVYTALRRYSAFSQVLMTVSLIGVSLPTFLIGIILIQVFAVELHWLPPQGRVGGEDDLVRLGWWTTGLLSLEGWRRIILPAITLGMFQMTLIMRLVRAEMLEVLRTDFIKFARARGLTDRAVHFGHALRNTMVPVITITGLQFGTIIAFAIITERVFNWPGVGQMFLDAVIHVDIPVMAAYLVLIAMVFVVVNLAVDILYFVVDPRLRVERSTTGH
ncbi:MAG: ABC transporter permease [Rhodospirillaceae bacterium]|nr:ABC transporter permease [Rhodospirillaceae bacterium]MCA8933224.1 ABC transporter permease [Rhodospirillaceae bacterium]